MVNENLVRLLDSYNFSQDTDHHSEDTLKGFGNTVYGVRLLLELSLQKGRITPECIPLLKASSVTLEQYYGRIDFDGLKEYRGVVAVDILFATSPLVARLVSGLGRLSASQPITSETSALKESLDCVVEIFALDEGNRFRESVEKLKIELRYATLRR